MRNSSVRTPSPVDGKVPDRADEGRSVMGIDVARKLRQTSTTPEIKRWQLSNLQSILPIAQSQFVVHNQQVRYKS
jgi:hypothetical protein